MKKNLRFLVVAAVGFVGALAFSSCAYDPYYTSVGGSYSTGYGEGYGYGGSSFSTSVFVGTGDPRWGYDPYCYSYYDYTRRAYYDPYLNGYYPVGYRPQVVYGVSHPYGWSPGSGYCRPPSRVTNVTIANYRNRESAYRNSGYIQSGRSYAQRPVQGGYNGGNYQSRPAQGGYNGGNYQSRTVQGGYNGGNYQSRPAQGGYNGGSNQSRPAQGGYNGGSNQSRPTQIRPNSRQIQESRPSAQPSQQGSGPGRYRNNSAQQAPSYPSRYNTPVTDSQPALSRGSRGQSSPQAAQVTPRQMGEIRPLAQPDESRAPRQPMQAPQPQAPQPQIQQSQPESPPPSSRGSRGDRQGGPPQGDGSGSGRRGRGQEAE